LMRRRLRAMAEDIWDEKPEAGRDIFGVNIAYEKDEMDAWLEKLRAHYKLVEERLKMIEAEG